MSLFSSEAMIAAGMSISAMLGSKSIHEEIVIAAPPEKVWEVLVDVERYQEWNPAITLVEGSLAVGNKVTYHFIEAEDKGANISSKVVAIKPNTHLNHKGGYWAVLTFDQHYRLEAHPAGTLFTVHEDYTGVWVNFWDHSDTEKQYKRMIEALKQRVLSLNGEQI